MVPIPAEGEAVEADTSLSTKVAGLVEIGIQAFADRDVAKLETCLKDVLSVVLELRDKEPNAAFDEDLMEAMMKTMKGEDGGQEEYDNLVAQKKEEAGVCREYERMTQLPGTRLPEFIRLCIDQEDNPQIFLTTAEIILKLDGCRSADDDHDELSLPVNPIPEKLFRIMSSSQDLTVLKRAFILARDTIYRTKDLDSNPLLGPAFVDILLRLGIQYPEENGFNCGVFGITGFFENNLCTTKYLGRTRATAVIRKVLNIVADIIANDSSSTALLVFALKLFTSVSVTKKRGELRLMINGWIQEGLHRLIELLHDPDPDVQAAAMKIFQDVIRSSPEIAKDVVDAGIFIKVAAALNRQEFDDLGRYALLLLCKSIVKKQAEDWIIEGIVEAQLPQILTQRFLNTDDMGNMQRHMEDEAIAVQCLRKLCEFAPLNLAKNFLESGTVLEWLNYIKQDPYTLSRFNFLKVILKYLFPTLKNGHLPSFEALTQMMADTVGLDVAERIEAVKSPEDLGIQLDPDDIFATFLEYKESDTEATDKGSDSEGIDKGSDSEGSDSEGTDEGSDSEGTDEGSVYD